MTCVPVPTGLADVVIDSDINLRIQLQGEDTKRRDKVAPSLAVAPRILPPSTSQDWAAGLGARHEGEA
jgi:hypothetical protein